MASHALDDGFHEIQLNGKQLVFVFMAATVLSVVIFLCGVLVGRGVRIERGSTAGLTDPAPPAIAALEETKPNLATPERPPTVVQPGNDPTKALPPAPPNADGESGGPGPRAAAQDSATNTVAAPPIATKVESAKSETTKSVPAPAPAPASAAASKPVASSAPIRPVETAVAPDAAKPVATSGIPTADDPRQGWVIQVAATKTRGEADTMAKRLSAKGYSAFVLSNSANVFRVRVGGYKSRGDAETVAAKLQKEERINPWVTR